MNVALLDDGSHRPTEPGLRQAATGDVSKTIFFKTETKAQEQRHLLLLSDARNWKPVVVKTSDRRSKDRHYKCRVSIVLQ